MIFVDSSYFIAIAREKDRWHKDALKLVDKTNDSMMISDFIISESYTGGVAGRREGRQDTL